MGFFDKLFGVNASVDKQPDIKFGRFSDLYKSKKQRDFWDKSVKAFDSDKYLESLDLLCKYLKDDNTTNITWSIEGGVFKAKLYQGSKKIFCELKEDILHVYAKVAQTDALNIGFMRRLMEQNYVMKYARYALDHDEDLCMIFDTPLSGASPSKMYYALKEVAVNVDKQDDLLIDEFEGLNAVNDIHIQSIPEEIQNIKINFIRQSIKEGIDLIQNGKLDIVKDHGGPSFLLLSIVYKLDYLIHPEGFITSIFEEIHQDYFSNTGKSNIQKNEDIVIKLDEILNRTDEELKLELYDVDSTFGITKAGSHTTLVQSIQAELPRMDYYYKNEHFNYALAIPKYVLGSAQFNFSLPKPDLELIHLFWQVMESKFFRDLGFTFDYFKEGTFNNKSISSKITDIVNRNKDEFVIKNLDTSLLDFSNKAQFAKSFLTLLSKLEIKPIEK